MKTTLAVITLALVACSVEAPTETPVNDSTAVDSVLVIPYDSTKIDSVRVDSNLNPLNIRK